MESTPTPATATKKLSAIERQRLARQQEMQKLVIREHQRISKDQQNLAGTGKRIANEPDPTLIKEKSSDEFNFLIVSFVSAHETDSNGMLTKTKSTFVKIRGGASTFELAKVKSLEISKIDPDFDCFVVEGFSWFRSPPSPKEIGEIQVDYNQPELKSIFDQYYKREELNRQETTKRAKEMQRVANDRARAAGIDVDAFKSSENQPNHPVNFALHCVNRDLISLKDEKLAQFGRSLQSSIQQIKVDNNIQARRLHVAKLKERLHDIQLEIRTAADGYFKAEDLARALNGLTTLSNIVKEKLDTEAFLTQA